MHYSGYDNNNNIIDENIDLTFETFGDESYVARNVNIKKYSKVELINESGDITAIRTQGDCVP